MVTKENFIEAIAKHLPPSSSNLNLLDIGGVAGDTLLKHRADLELVTASLSVENWQYEQNQYDAVVAYDLLLGDDLLQNVLSIMRYGGRFIVVNPYEDVSEKWVKLLEDFAYIRILVEPAYEGQGVLIRGEKAHITDNTLERVHQTAKADADLLDFDSYKGRYVHLLIIQSPNKPVWKLSPSDKIEWQAVSIEKDNKTFLLAFSSLPKAVSFMQPAVLAGIIKDVNKVGKFSKATARNWDYRILLNPVLDDILDYNVTLWAVNSDTAEASDE